MSAAKTILVVEDEALVREVAVLEFEDAGFNVLSAADGEQALALLAGPGAVDVLFTDISLRDSIDGWTLAAQARELRPALQVIYATGYAESAPQLVAGARFFKKPYLPSQVIAAIHEMVGGVS